LGLVLSALLYWGVAASVAAWAYHVAVTKSGWASLYIDFITVPILVHVILSIVTTVGAIFSYQRLMRLGKVVHAVALLPYFAVGVAIHSPEPCTTARSNR